MSHLITLDRPREVRWNQRAEARLDSVPRARRAGAFYQVCAIIWAALVDRDHPFEDPEDLAQYIADPERLAAASRVILAARKEARDREKNGDGSTPKPGRSSS